MSHRREIADKMLVYLKKNNIKSCTKSYEVLEAIAESIDEPLFDVWKGYELLRIMARIELNNPNGRKGFRVLAYNPIALGLPDRPSVPICEAGNCPIWKILNKKWSKNIGGNIGQ